MTSYKNILHLGHFKLTKELIHLGVRPAKDKRTAMELLEFSKLPDSNELHRRATELADIAKRSDCDAVLLGCLPYMIVELEGALRKVGIPFLYPFTERTKKVNGSGYDHKLIALISGE